MAEVLNDINVIIQEILTSYSQKKIQEMRAILSGRGKIARGILIESIMAKIDEKGLSISYPGYGKYVQKGRRPGKLPPLKNIEEWSRIKGIPEEMAFPIAKKISEQGTKAVDFTKPFYDGIKELTKEVAKKFGKEVASQLAQEISKAFVQK